MNTDKIALITEAGNGFGHKFATLLENHGFSVIIATKGEVYHTRQTLTQGNIEILKTDLTQRRDITQLHDYIKKRYDKLDVLINNGEIANGFGQKIDQLRMEEDVKSLYEVNLFSILEITKTMLPLLKKSDMGKIINISSALGDINKMKDDGFHYANYQMTAYATAKAALEMFTVLLSRELRTTKIQVNSFDPIRLKNCTHNDVAICNQVEKELLELLDIGKVVGPAALSFFK
ncbi:SDR family NAD(P)-dependent oxidoreductase [Ulvibacterium sp.]|uniref:SDR family NAD(P)-dependent oxidoreductase n=1 Tax=Ulvibacterium sp. TaxID=2665914 RepID=UPI0026029B81|nr:SDR family NAD(P)-dependent oxidoreductase [Ulvibacterium sp.]